MSLNGEIDREREISRDLRIRLIAEEDKVREVKREVTLVREEMELRAKQQVEIVLSEKSESHVSFSLSLLCPHVFDSLSLSLLSHEIDDLQDKLRTQSVELQRVKEELVSMANRTATALQQAQVAKAEADSIRAESSSVISEGHTSHAALMQALQRITTYENEVFGASCTS